MEIANNNTSNPFVKISEFWFRHNIAWFIFWKYKIYITYSIGIMSPYVQAKRFIVRNQYYWYTTQQQLNKFGNHVLEEVSSINCLYY